MGETSRKTARICPKLNISSSTCAEARDLKTRTDTHAPATKAQYT
jgi:hypothetical protein